MITKYLYFEKHILNAYKLNDLNLALRTPQVGAKRFDFTIDNGKIEIHDPNFNTNKCYDFVVLADGTLMIGYMHYRLSNSSKTIKGAGELKVNSDGKIWYINNQSGHYKPSENHLLDISIEFEKLGLLSPDIEVESLYEFHTKFR